MVIEQDSELGLDLIMGLRKRGRPVAGPFPDVNTVQRFMRLATPRAAIINAALPAALEVSDALTRYDIPIVFYSDDGIPPFGLAYGIVLPACASRDLTGLVAMSLDAIENVARATAA